MKNSVFLRYILFGFIIFHLPLTLPAQKIRPIKINAGNANLYRDSLVRFVFGTAVLPSGVPDSIIRDVRSIDLLPDFPYNGLYYPAGNLQSIDKLLVTVDPNTLLFPEKVRAYVFHPQHANGKLFIYHAGHCAGTAVAEDLIANMNGLAPGRVIPRMIQEGYTVLALPMIHYRNNPPAGYFCGFNGHDALFTEGNYAFPLGLFFKPLVSCLNFLNRNLYQEIILCGLSGGGWIASIYPALDSSISRSIPVAGSWPLPVQQAFNPGSGDYEQTYLPLFHDFLDYTDLYTLGCLAPARKMLQINNSNDPCCFNGTKAHLYYADSVSRAVANGGGQYQLYIDQTARAHHISGRALEVIGRFIKNESATLRYEPSDTLENGEPIVFNLFDPFETNPATPNNRLSASLLQAPSWLSLDAATGALRGSPPPGNLIAGVDTISFQVEDEEGHFVLYNYMLTKKREGPWLATANDRADQVFWLPEFSGALADASPGMESGFSSNNPALQVLQVTVLNGSVMMLQMNRDVQASDSLRYQGQFGPNPVRFRNGQAAENFSLSPVQQTTLQNRVALPGMMRFNTDTRKFEYYNGTRWVNMH